MRGISVTNELDAELASSDPLGWPGYRDTLGRARMRSERQESVHVAEVLIDGNAALLVEFDFRFLGGSLGEATGDKVVRAFEHARERQLPVISVVASGGARMQEGMRSLLQLQRIAAAAVRARADGIPHIAVLRHPTTGGVWVALASNADVVLALPGAQVSFAGSRVRDQDPGDTGLPFTAEGKLAAGFVDALESELTLELDAGPRGRAAVAAFARRRERARRPARARRAAPFGRRLGQRAACPRSPAPAGKCLPRRLLRVAARALRRSRRRHRPGHADRRRPPARPQHCLCRPGGHRHHAGRLPCRRPARAPG